MFCLSKVDQEVDNYWQKGDDAAQSVKGYDCSIIYYFKEKNVKHLFAFFIVQPILCGIGEKSMIVFIL